MRGKKGKLWGVQGWGGWWWFHCISCWIGEKKWGWKRGKLIQVMGMLIKINFFKVSTLWKELFLSLIQYFHFSKVATLRKLQLFPILIQYFHVDPIFPSKIQQLWILRAPKHQKNPIYTWKKWGGSNGNADKKLIFPRFQPFGRSRFLFWSHFSKQNSVDVNSQSSPAPKKSEFSIKNWSTTFPKFPGIGKNQLGDP